MTPIIAPKKLIEVALPLDAINKEAAREKSIRHGHPSTLHLWWARRPLAAARAVIFAQLVHDPAALWEAQHPGETPSPQQRGGFAQRRKYLFDLIGKLVLWENTQNEQVLGQARAEIRKAWQETCALNAGHPEAATLFDPNQMPGLHDPFAGGGTIPLEAQRLGLQAYASDLNPVAVLINKAMIEIPPKFAGLAPVHPDARRDAGMKPWRGAQGLAEDVRRYGAWMRDEAERRIGHLYPKVRVTAQMAVQRPDLQDYVGKDLTVIAWLWARTVRSPNPAFRHVEVPLVSTFVLSSKEGKQSWVEPVVEGDRYRFVVRTGEPPAGAENGTKLGRGANFRCILSDTPIEPDYIKAEGIAGRLGQRLLAVVAEGVRARVYLPPDSRDEEIARSAQPSWTPELNLPNDPRNFWTLSYGLTTYGDLFTPRQLVALTTFSDLVGEARERARQDAVAAGMGPHPLAPSPSRGEGEQGGQGEREEGRLVVPVEVERRGTEVARLLRRRSTPSEALLWEQLRGSKLGVRFRRQQPIGPFVVDFFCAAARLIVEVDGPIHDDQKEADRERQDLLEACGYTVKRFTAAAVEQNAAQVAQQIRLNLPPSPPSPSPLEGEGAPQSGGGEGLEAGGTGATAYGEAVGVYLAFALSKIANIGSSIASWMNDRGAFRETFARQAIPMVWDFAEANTFADAGGSIGTAIDKISQAVESLPASQMGMVRQENASKQLTSNRNFVSTDPPYYDNIGYADLSDYFYVWLRKTVGAILPALFSTMAVPKAEELVATPYRHGGKPQAERFFLDGMTAALTQISSMSHPSAPVAIYYAFKQSETKEDSGTSSTGWETFLEAVLRADFALTGTWPMRTEGAGRIIAKDSNALASSIVLVCRRRAVTAATISRREFLRELNAVLPAALEEMTKGAGAEQSPVAPVDLSQAIIGPGMAVFSQYAAVLEADGSPMSVKTALQLINRFLAEDDFDRDSQFCLHWFDQHGWAEGAYGDADVLARAKATSVAGLTEAGVVASGGGKVRLLRPAEYPADWDPATDKRRSVWESLHHLVRLFRQDGESGAGRLLAAVQDQTDAIRQLAYRLYTLCERRGWAEAARPYNELVSAWAGVEKVAVATPVAAKGPAQGRLF